MKYLLIFIFNILILLILLISIAISKNKTKIVKRFCYLIFAAMFEVFMVGAGEALDGVKNIDIILKLINLLIYGSVDLLICSFCEYLLVLLETQANRKINKKPLQAVILLTIIRAIVIIILTFTGHLFSIKDGIYYEESLASIPYFISAVVLLLLLIVVICNYKLFTKKQFIVIILYQLIPIIAVTLENFTNIYSLTPCSITLSVTLIYVFIQDNNENAAIEKQQALEEISYVDLLTGINNRRAYYKRLSNIQKLKHYGVLYCDINGLKYTNDHYGHTKGDELIVRFANILTNSFSKDNIYRVSGDEFVVIYESEAATDFEIIVNLFKSINANNDNLAAIGSMYGIGLDIESLINQAEENMYHDKSFVIDKYRR